MMKAQWQWIISGVVILIAGIFVLVNPTLVVKIAVLSFGVYTLIEGIYSLILSWAVRKATGIFRANIVRTLISTGIGILVIWAAASASGAQVASWAVYLIAIWLLLSGLSELIELFVLRRMGYESFGVVTGAVISIILSVVMFLFPVLVNNAVVTVIGVGMVLVSVFLILWGIKMLSFEKKVFEKSHQESETDWEEL